MSTAKLPTRTRPDDGRFRGGRLRLVEGVAHPDPPPAPDHLSRREAELGGTRERRHHELALENVELRETQLAGSVSARAARWSEQSVTKMVATYAHAVDERRLDEIDAAFAVKRDAEPA